MTSFCHQKIAIIFCVMSQLFNRTTFIKYIITSCGSIYRVKQYTVKWYAIMLFVVLFPCCLPACLLACLQLIFTSLSFFLLCGIRCSTPIAHRTEGNIHATNSLLYSRIWCCRAKGIPQGRQGTPRKSHAKVVRALLQNCTCVVKHHHNSSYLKLWECTSIYILHRVCYILFHIAPFFILNFRVINWKKKRKKNFFFLSFSIVYKLSVRALSMYIYIWNRGCYYIDFNVIVRTFFSFFFSFLKATG